MRYFGKRTSAPVYDECVQVQTPVGTRCGHCDEPIAAGDDGWLYPYLGGPHDPPELAYHYECALRGIVGCVEHQLRHPHGGGCDGTCRDSPELTRREAAQAATDLFEGRLRRVKA